MSAHPSPRPIFGGTPAKGLTGYSLYIRFAVKPLSAAAGEFAKCRRAMFASAPRAVLESLAKKKETKTKNHGNPGDGIGRG